MNILLTGGAGYIGSHTTVVLLKAGYKVVLFDNLSNSQRDVVTHLEAIVGCSITFVDGDVRDSKLLSETICDHSIDAVIHFAGLKSVSESVSKPLDYFDNNVGGTISLLKAMQSNNVKSIVFSSSATVYGDPNYLPIDEVHPTGSTNPYGRTKLHIEEILRDVSFSDSSWGVACLRYFNPAGAHESGLIGENPNGIPNNLMPYVSRVAAGLYPSVKVFGDDYPTIDGSGVRDYIHVVDLAEGHLAAIDFLTRGNKGWHAINLGTGSGTSVLEMINHFASVSGKPIPYEIVSRRAGDIASCYASASKAFQLLNWKATRGIEEMCASAWNWQVMSSD